MTNLVLLKKYANNNDVKKRMEDILDRNAPAFISSIINTVGNSRQLQECKPESIMNAAFIAAALKLPIDPNLGFSAIVPYKDKASFQIMAKGFIQLAIRTGKYKNIHVSEVYKDELDFYNPVTGEIKFTEVKGWKDRYSGKYEPCGYYARFEINSGFIKEDYKSREELRNHAEKYSQSYRNDLKFKKQSSVWSSDFSAMAKKTMLKLLLSKYGILSIELQEAIIKDHTADSEYIDNPQTETKETIDAEVSGKSAQQTLNDI
jgi:recombination protein RecT